MNLFTIGRSMGFDLLHGVSETKQIGKIEPCRQKLYALITFLVRLYSIIKQTQLWMDINPQAWKLLSYNNPKRGNAAKGPPC